MASLVDEKRTFKLGVRSGHNRGVQGPVGLNSIGLVGILVGGGSLKWHILVLVPGAMLRYVRLNLVRWVLVLHPHQCLSKPCPMCLSASVPWQNPSPAVRCQMHHCMPVPGLARQNLH